MKQNQTLGVEHEMRHHRSLFLGCFLHVTLRLSDQTFVFELLEDTFQPLSVLLLTNRSFHLDSASPRNLLELERSLKAAAAPSERTVFIFIFLLSTEHGGTLTALSNKFPFKLSQLFFEAKSYKCGDVQIVHLFFLIYFSILFKFTLNKYLMRTFPDSSI